MDKVEVKDLREVMEAISDTVPDLLRSINEALFKGQESNRVGNAVATFYRHLVESGVPPDQAYQLTREYMSSVSIGSMLRNLNIDHHH